MKHPKGLYVLFLLEMWERFSYYGMRAILVLFMVDSISNGGMNWSNEEALGLYGWYTMTVYVLTIVGGVVADRFLGRKKTVLLGGFLLCVGHILMAFPANWTFFSALALIVLGVGGLKGNATALVGDLYQRNDPLREEGFTLYYMGINIGALLSTLTVSYVGEVYGWHYGFGLAGIGMILGQVVYLGGLKHITSVEVVKESIEENSKEVSKGNLKDVLLGFILVFVFWVGYEQQGGMITFFTRDHIDRVILGWEVPTGMFQSLTAGGILLFGAIVSGFWRRRPHFTELQKMGIGVAVMGLGYVFMIFSGITASEGDKASVLLLIGMYLFHVLGELCLSPVANSFVSKKSPAAVVGLMMGLMFAVTGGANKVASEIGKLANTKGYTTVFILLMVSSIVIGLAFYMYATYLNKSKKISPKN